MNTFFNVVFIIHIVGGSVGLLTGLMNLLRKKGDINHKFVGKIFFISMLTAGISSLVLASLHSNSFLFLVGIFTLYMVCSGQLYLHRNNNITYERLERTMSSLMLLAGILFVGIGVLILIKTNLFGLVFITFGCLGLFLVHQDFKNYKEKSKLKNSWIVAHLQRMTGGFLATLTAFLVVNKNYFPEHIPSILFWLLPTFVLTPLIFKWSRKYQRK